MISVSLFAITETNKQHSTIYRWHRAKAETKPTAHA